MIIIVAALTAVCVSAYGFVPADRTGLYKDVVLILLGLLGGKLSNAFGKEPNFTPLTGVAETPAHENENEQEEEEETSQ